MSLSAIQVKVPTCERCGQKPALERNKLCEGCRAVVNVGMRYRNRNIPKRTFDHLKNFGDGHPAHQLYNVLQKETHLLTGPLGIGKSALAARIVWDHPGKLRLAYFVTLDDLINEIRHAWKHSTELEVLTRFREYELLVIDEVGVRPGSPDVQRLVYSVIVGRYNDNAPTILTTNLNPNKRPDQAELAECLGVRVLDRIMPGWLDCSDWPRLRR